MKKGAFCDETLRLLSRGAYSKSEFLFERRDVAMWINPGIGMAVKANFWENYKLGDKGTIDSGFLTAFDNVPVLFSAFRNAYYSDLPSLPISMEGGLGLYEIAPTQDASSAFVPMRAGASSLFKGLAAENLFGEIGFRQEGKRVWYKNVNLVGVDITLVNMLIVADTNDLSMDDELPIPADSLQMIWDYVLSKMGTGVQQPADGVIDDNPTKT